jgi:hypothetical protein
MKKIYAFLLLFIFADAGLCAVYSLGNQGQLAEADLYSQAFNYLNQPAGEALVEALCRHPKLDVRTLLLDGSPFLHEVIKSGMVRPLTALLSRPDFDINVLDHSEKSALAIALRRGFRHAAEDIVFHKRFTAESAEVKNAVKRFLMATANARGYKDDIHRLKEKGIGMEELTPDDLRIINQLIGPDHFYDMPRMIRG